MKKILACALALMLALACAGALAEGATLTVQGAGMVEVDADCATICVGVREAAADVQEAQAAVNEKLAAVVDALSAMGIGGEHISTNTISIYPNYDYSSDMEQIVGYSANNSILVTTGDIDSVGTYIDAAFAAGANSLDYVEFTASNTDAAGSQALALAVGNAQDKARVLAEAAGKRVGAILEIREGTSNEYDMPVMYARTEDAGAGTQVFASKQRVTAAVSVVFELADAE